MAPWRSVSVMNPARIPASSTTGMQPIFRKGRNARGARLLGESHQGEAGLQGAAVQILGASRDPGENCPLDGMA